MDVDEAADDVREPTWWDAESTSSQQGVLTQIVWNILYVCIWAATLAWAVSKSMCVMVFECTLSWLDVRMAFKDEVVASFAITIDSVKLDAKRRPGFQEIVF